MIWILTIWIAYLYGEIFNANIKIRWKKSVWTEFNYPLTSLEHLLYCYTLYTLQDRNTRGEILGLCNNFRFYKPGAWPTVWCQTLTMKDNTDYELDAFHILKEDNFLKLKNRGSEFFFFFNQRDYFSYNETKFSSSFLLNTCVILSLCPWPEGEENSCDGDESRMFSCWRAAKPTSLVYSQYSTWELCCQACKSPLRGTRVVKLQYSI